MRATVSIPALIASMRASVAKDVTMVHTFSAKQQLVLARDSRKHSRQQRGDGQQQNAGRYRAQVRLLFLEGSVV